MRPEDLKAMAIRIFRSRGEVKDDWHWRKRTREWIRSLIRQYRERTA